MSSKLKSADFNQLLQEKGDAAVLRALDGAEIFTARKAGEANLAPQENFTFPIPTPFKWIDPRRIPPRGFVYGSHFVRKYASCTIAPTKTGKTSLLIAELLSIATGNPLLDITPREIGNVWLWNGEDPRDDLQARVAAAMLAHGLNPEEVEGRFFIDSGRDQALVLARQTRDGNVIAEPVEKHLIEYLRDLEIIAAAVDPFVSSHRIPENDNTLIDAVVKSWARIADKANCAIDLVHHPRKTNGSEVTAEDGRGASALISACRSQRVLNRMTKEQAQELGIPDGQHRRYFRIGGADSNLAPPLDESRWHQLITVDLGNGDPEGIGAVKRWKPAGLFEGTASDVLLKVQKRVAEGTYRENSQAADWVGKAIAAEIGADLSDKAGRRRVRRMLETWIKSGALKVAEHQDKNREYKKFVEVGQWAS
jgi:hypothetical protein